MAAGKSWQKLNWQDPFLLEQQLTDEQRMVRDSARKYAQDKLLPRVRNAFRNEETDPAIFREMGELGLLGSTTKSAIPVESFTYKTFLQLLPPSVVLKSPR